MAQGGVARPLHALEAIGGLAGMAERAPEWDPARSSALCDVGEGLNLTKPQFPHL